MEKTKSAKSGLKNDVHLAEVIDDEQIFTIMITTDNHLGYKEEDKITGNDSFYAFNEALQL